MTDLEISKALALAIGWNGNCVRLISGYIWCYVKDRGWRLFDYRDWAVAGPIAEKFDCFPYKNSANNWVTTLGGRGRAPWPFYAAETPQKAIALAVINGSKK